MGDHSGGQALANSVKVVSNKVMGGQTADHYTFNPTTTSSIPTITASGTGPNFAYHGPTHRGGGSLHLAGVDTPTCICNTGIKGSINGVPFSKNCAPEPTGDLLQQKNPTCWVDTYEGGLSCCHHKNVLLDKDQEQPSDLLTYHLKFRFYFQPYEPEVVTSPASHQNLVRLYFQTEAWAGEYDVPKADAITPPEMSI